MHPVCLQNTVQTYSTIIVFISLVTIPIYIYGSIILVKILCPLCGILYCLHKYTISICTYVCIYDMKILIHKLYLLVALSLMETVLEQMDFACRRQTVENQTKHFSTKRKAIVSKTYTVIIQFLNKVLKPTITLYKFHYIRASKSY